jgi:hypothetical protein
MWFERKGCPALLSFKSEGLQPLSTELRTKIGILSWCLHGCPSELRKVSSFLISSCSELRTQTAQTDNIRGFETNLIKRQQKPIALFIDDANDLHGKTLVGLKRLIEVVRDSGGMLSVVLAGHPKESISNRGLRSLLCQVGLLIGSHPGIPASKGLSKFVVEHLRSHLQ